MSGSVEYIIAISAEPPHELKQAAQQPSVCSCFLLAKCPVQVFAAACLHGVARRLGQASAQVDGEGSRHSAQANQQAPTRWWHGGAGEDESH